MDLEFTLTNLVKKISLCQLSRRADMLNVTNLQTWFVSDLNKKKCIAFNGYTRTCHSYDALSIKMRKGL